MWPFQCSLTYSIDVGTYFLFLLSLPDIVLYSSVCFLQPWLVLEEATMPILVGFLVLTFYFIIAMFLFPFDDRLLQLEEKNIVQRFEK
jgi:phosphotransferase system  glucose/maltose/N-acetylglucosamine-specific IIC component